jgi:hypothetical protein
MLSSSFYLSFLFVILFFLRCKSKILLYLQQALSAKDTTKFAFVDTHQPYLLIFPAANAYFLSFIVI